VEKGNIPHTIQGTKEGRKEGRMVNWMRHIVLELPSKPWYSRKDRRGGKMRKQTKAATE
jgi:hypothetical protein